MLGFGSTYTVVRDEYHTMKEETHITYVNEDDYSKYDVVLYKDLSYHFVDGYYEKNGYKYDR